MSELTQRKKPKQAEETPAKANNQEDNKPAEKKSNMFKYLALLFLLASVGCLAVFLYPFGASYFGGNHEITYDGNVMVLTDANFDRAVGDNPLMLVEFYAPWCYHCKNLAPVYNEVADIFAQEEEGSQKVTIAKIDAHEYRQAAQKYQIPGYPTLKFFNNGRVVDYKYKSKESAAAFVEKLKVMSQPAVGHIESEAELIEVLANFPVLMMGYFPDKVNEAYESVAEKISPVAGKVVFFSVSSSELAEEMELESGKVALFNGEARADFKQQMNEADLDNFLSQNNVFNLLNKHKLPLVSEFNEDTAHDLFQNNPDAKHAMVFISKDSEDFESVMESVKEAAEQMEDSELIFSVADVNDDYVESNAKYFKLDVSDEPAFRVFSFENGSMKKFKTEKVTTESMVELSKKFLAGNAEEFFVSEEVPENWNEGPVKVLVGKNFKEVAFNENKKVLVYFNFPGSREEKHFGPIVEELGEMYKDSDDVIVAKMDFSANDAEGFKMSSLFTLFQSGEDGKAVGYEVSLIYN